MKIITLEKAFHHKLESHYNMNRLVWENTFQRNFESHFNYIFKHEYHGQETFELLFNVALIIANQFTFMHRGIETGIETETKT